MKAWIPITERRPPKTYESQETSGYYWVLVPYGDNRTKCHVMMWRGGPLSQATHWAKIEPFPSLPDGLACE